MSSDDKNRGHARARRTDPWTSHAAAREIESKGRAESHRRLCLAEVQQTPGQTSAEIASRVGIDRNAAARRLPELREMGLVHNGSEARTCTIVGSKCITWWPGKAGAKQLPAGYWDT